MISPPAACEGSAPVASSYPFTRNSRTWMTRLPMRIPRSAAPVASPREPVDHTDADEGDADVARDDDRLVRGGQAEAGEHLRGKEREAEAEDDRQDGADLQ